MSVQEHRPEPLTSPRRNGTDPADGQPSPTPGKKTRAPIVVVAVAAIFGLLFTMGMLPRIRQANVLHAEAKEAVSTPAVLVVTPIHSTEDTDLVLPGNIQATEQTPINARTTGYVKRRYVDIGSKVTAGQLLAEVEAPEADQQLNQAKADASKAEANVGQAQAALSQTQAAVQQTRSEVSHQEALLESSHADQSRMQATLATAKSDVAHAQAGLAQARSEVKKAEANLAQYQAAANRAQAGISQARQDVTQKQAELAQAKTNRDIAEKTTQRWATLAKQGAVSVQEADEKRATYEARIADVNAAQAAIASYEQRIAQAQASYQASLSDVEAAKAAVGSMQETVNAAQAGVQSSQSNVEAAQSSVSAAEANVRSAQANVKSAQANVRAAQAKVASSMKDVEAAKAAVRSAEANTQRYAAMQGFQRVTAPFAGVITSRNVDTGTLVNAGGSGAGAGASNSTNAATGGGLFGLARTDLLRIQVNVPQTFVNAVKQGQRAIVTIREIPHREFTGAVLQVAGALDADTRTRLIEIQLPNPQGLLVPGMYAEVHLIPQGEARPLRIPANTLIVNAGGTQVAVAVNGKVHLADITLGRDLGTELEVTKGLTGTEELITNPSDELREGMAVDAKPAPKEDKPEGGPGGPGGKGGPGKGGHGAAPGGPAAGGAPAGGAPAKH